MKYCSNCSAEVTLKEVEEDHRKRYVCDACDIVHYQNPNVVVGTIPIWKDKILLAKRGIEPRIGFWNLPAGFLENQETTEQGAQRELFEETLAHVQNLKLFSVYSVPRINQVHIYYRAELVNDQWSLTTESTDIQLYAPSEIPWDQIAFPSTTFALKKYVEDIELGTFGVHQGHFEWPQNWEKYLKDNDAEEYL